VIKRTHRHVGLALMEKWNLPPAVCKSIQDCSEYDSANRASISNAVCFANALAKQHGIAPDDSDIEDAKALVMIGRSVLGADDSLVSPLVAGLKAKLEHLYE
jgi:HD-like signal output (HDOD) protein